MQSIIQKKSYGSVKVYFLDSDLLKERITTIIHKLTAEKPEVRRVILFGSVAEGKALPSSDVDLLIVIDGSTERFIDRPSNYLPYFESIPLDVDCFVYTAEEIDSGRHPIAETANRHGKVLYNRNLSRD